MNRATKLCPQLRGMDPRSRQGRHGTEKCYWGHRQPWQEICAIRNTTVSKSSQRQSSRALAEGCLNHGRWSGTQTTHGKKAKRRVWCSGWGAEEDQYLQWQLLFGLGGCPQAGATLTCNFKHVLVPFGIFQLCQRHSCQRQPSLGEWRRSQCLHLLPGWRCSARFS